MKAFYKTRNRYHKHLHVRGKSPWNSRQRAEHYQRYLISIAQPQAHAAFTFARVSFNKDPLLSKSVKLKLTSGIGLSYGLIYHMLNPDTPLVASGTIIASHRHTDDDSLIDLGISIHRVPLQQPRFIIPKHLWRYESVLEECDFYFPTAGSVLYVLYQPTPTGRRPPKYQGYVAGYYLGQGKDSHLEYQQIPPQLIRHPSLES